MSKVITILIIVAAVFGGVYYLYYSPALNGEAAPPKRLAFLTASDLQLPAVEGVKEGLKELGYEEGIDVVYELYNPQGDRELTAQMARDIVASNPDIIISVSTTASTNVKEANAEARIPQVFVDVGNLARLDVENLQRPGSFFTGNSVDNVPTSSKRMEILKELLPDLGTVGVMLNSEHVSYNTIKAVHNEGARNLGLEVIYYDITKEEDLSNMLAKLVADKPDAVMTTSEAILSGNAELIAEELKKAKIPSIDFNSERGVQSGYLLSLGVTRFDVGVDGARFVDRVLRGQDPGTIPIEFGGAPTLEINMATARAIGIEIPESLLLQARNIVE